MGSRGSIYTGVVFAIVGLIAGIFVFSTDPTPDLPAFLLFLLCPASLLAAMSPTAGSDSDFMWLLVVLNAGFYGLIGAYLGKFLHFDRE